LNQIVCELPSEHPLSETRPLRELLGHTPTQVCSDVLFLCILLLLGKMKAMAYGYQVNLKVTVPRHHTPILHGKTCLSAINIMQLRQHHHVLAAYIHELTFFYIYVADFLSV